MAYCEVCKEVMLTEWPHVHDAPAEPPVVVARAVAAKMIERMVEAHECHVSANDECSCKSHIARELGAGGVVSDEEARRLIAILRDGLAKLQRPVGA